MKMRIDKILLCLSNINDLVNFKKLGITNFLFPLENFSVGYTTFSLEEIEKCKLSAYILINRILTDADIDEFMKLEVPKNVRGFVIEDTGLMYELRDSKYELINFQNHLNNNYETVNFWLDHFDSLVISTDITRDEVNKILEMSKKPLVLPLFWIPMIMYSRRSLVTNYHKHIGQKNKPAIDIDIDEIDLHFHLVENEYGTSVFNKKVIDARKILDDIDEAKIKFYLVGSEFVSNSIIEKFLNGEDIENTTEGFLNKKTVYRIEDIK